MAPTIEWVIAHIVEMRVGFAYSTGTLGRARAIIWEIHAGSRTGWGECQFAAEESTPGIAMALGEDTPGGLHDALYPYVWPMIGCSASGLEALLPAMPDELDWDLLVVREGLSIALHDLVGKESGLPAHALLGGKRRSRVPGMPVIHVAPPEVMVRRAQAWAQEGYRFLKVKFRGDIGTDVEAVRGIRDAVGSEISLQVDANDGYAELDEAEAAIRALEPLGIDLFEDMLAAPIDRIAELRRHTGARIMVDRQATWPHVNEVIRAGAADVINHHPNNQGGLATALQIDAVATAAGLETAIGSSGLFGIQDAAFQALSSVIGLTRPCEDIGLLPYHSGPTEGEYAFDREPGVVEDPYPIERGVIHVSDRPGLGVKVDDDKLTACTVDKLLFE